MAFERGEPPQILALRRMIEEVKKDNLTAVMCFINFKKAFDSIHRGTIVKILKANGVPPNLLRTIESMYAGTRARVVTPDGNSEEFHPGWGAARKHPNPLPLHHSP